LAHHTADRTVISVRTSTEVRGRSARTAMLAPVATAPALPKVRPVLGDPRPGGQEPRGLMGSHTPGPKLPTRCVGRCSPGVCQAFKQGGCARVVPPSIGLSRGVAACPVSNVVGIGLRSRLVADACGAPVLPDQGPDCRAAHDKADLCWRPTVSVGPSVCPGPATPRTW
jgi:hypothetical protein